MDPDLVQGGIICDASVKKAVAVSWQVLGQGAVHGAFAGYTGFTVGLVNTHYVYAAAALFFTVSSAV